MNTRSIQEMPRGPAVICRELTIPELVVEVYDEAPAVEDRARLLNPLLAALGILPLASVAGGVFSRLRLADAGVEPGASLERLGQVGSSQVLALVEQAQQADPEAIYGLAGIMQSTPSLCATAAAALLLAVLARQAARVGGAP